MNKIIFLSAGTVCNKNDYKKYATDNGNYQQLYLNYGMLGLATNLRKKGYEVIMYQANEKTPQDFLDEIQLNCKINEIYPVFLSIPSFYQVEWTVLFSNLWKKAYPSSKLIAGGRWVIDKNLNWICNKLPQIDFFIKGCPDEDMEQFLDEQNWKNCRYEFQYQKPFDYFYYPLLNNYKQYQPIIEVSRGCGGGCDFCLESQYKVCKMKTPKQVIDEAEMILRQYEIEKTGEREFYFYFEGAMLAPTKSWAKDFSELYHKRNHHFGFRMQSRVDCLLPEVLKILGSCGLRVVDFGLESASSTQLLRMEKTKYPQIYLERAEKLLRVGKESGVWSKLNILLYPGETMSTIKETKMWLRKVKSNVKGISCNGLVIYLNGKDTDSYVDTIERMAGVNIDRNTLYRQGYVNARLGTGIDEEKIVNEFYQEFMTEQDYMDLKKITYLRRIEG